MSSRDEAVEALEDFIAAVASARVELRKTERFLRGALQMVNGGEPIESLIVSMPPSERRQEYQDALEEVNRCRHLARQKAFSLALERGVSISDLARAWGISRQLASRYVKDAGKALAPEHTASATQPDTFVGVTKGEEVAE